MTPEVYLKEFHTIFPHYTMYFPLKPLSGQVVCCPVSQNNKNKWVWDRKRQIKIKLELFSYKDAFAPFVEDSCGVYVRVVFHTLPWQLYQHVRKQHSLPDLHNAVWQSKQPPSEMTAYNLAGMWEQLAKAESNWCSEGLQQRLTLLESHREKCGKMYKVHRGPLDLTPLFGNGGVTETLRLLELVLSGDALFDVTQLGLPPVSGSHGGQGGQGGQGEVACRDVPQEVYNVVNALLLHAKRALMSHKPESDHMTFKILLDRLIDQFTTPVVSSSVVHYKRPANGAMASVVNYCLRRISLNRMTLCTLCVENRQT